MRRLGNFYFMLLIAHFFAGLVYRVEPNTYFEIFSLTGKHYEFLCLFALRL